MLKNLRYDLPASVVVVLVALPLCLGVALASGAPLFSGLIAGIVGGIVIGSLSKSPLSVSGPAAGLTVIVYNAIQTLPSYEAFLAAVVMAGAMQLGLGFLRAGIIGDFFPASVIKGMLAAIGLILILKQLPHAVGYDADYEGDDSFEQPDGENTLSSVWHLWDYNFLPGAVVIALSALIFLYVWEKWQAKQTSFVRYIPGPLLVVIGGVAAGMLFESYVPALTIGTAHRVSVPVSASLADFVGNFTFPDFSMLADKQVWIIAATLAAVASIETLLCIEAVDKIDPYKRITPTSRELVVQGIGNMTSGALGGLPVTSVIVRSSANVMAGGRTKTSTILHGVLLLACVLFIPQLLNKIPLSALAAILISVGYKLTKPSLYRQKYQQGWYKFAPFLVTVLAILFTNLLMGIAIGTTVGIFFVLHQNYHASILFVADGRNYLVRAKKDLFFMHKYELKRNLTRIPNDSKLLIDLSRLSFIDLDNVEIINDFMANAVHRNIAVTVKRNPEVKATTMIEEAAAA
ncbi:MAG: SulP family inorganic anion transporter [Proteobacteria bacterium]|nr:SulP family inorganic anion transporter [Pseudomonadota bacterium]